MVSTGLIDPGARMTLLGFTKNTDCLELKIIRAPKF